MQNNTLFSSSSYGESPDEHSPPLGVGGTRLTYTLVRRTSSSQQHNPHSATSIQAQAPEHTILRRKYWRLLLWEQFLQNPSRFGTAAPSPGPPVRLTCSWLSEVAAAKATLLYETAGEQTDGILTPLRGVILSRGPTIHASTSGSGNS